MRGETAAAYCNELSVDAFISKVKQGIYPKPCAQKGKLPKWLARSWMTPSRDGMGF
jgi:hypothetical protein